MKMPAWPPKCVPCGLVFDEDQPQDTYTGALHLGWALVVGLHGGGEDTWWWLCPHCRGGVAAGYDWVQYHGGEPLIAESVACAWAFQVGQYEDAARANPEWEKRGYWRDADFTVPETWGRYGWGRWSSVRRAAGELPPVPLTSNGELDAIEYQRQLERIEEALDAMEPTK